MSESSASAWNLSISTTEPGWVLVPVLDPEDHDAWVVGCVEQLGSAWGPERFGDGERVIVEGMLRDALERARAIEGMLFQVWPVFGPMAAHVTVDVSQSDASLDWRDRGFEIAPYDGASVGPGMQCVRVDHMARDGATVDLVEAAYLFDDGRSTLVVLVDETLAALFAKVLPGIIGLLANIELTAADGTRFEARPPVALEQSPDESWELHDDLFLDR